jgi:putative ABC transport system substrate-binding protein
LIVVEGPELSLQAVVGASGFVPIVIMAVNYDPLAHGYVQSLAHPGGNITGVIFRQLELAAKQVELLTQAFPEKRRLTALFDAQTADQLGEAEQSARFFDLHFQPFKLENPPYDFIIAFRSAAVRSAEMLLVLSSPAFTAYRSQIAELAIEKRLPTMFTFKHYAEAGGLMSYGFHFPTAYRRIAEYVAMILKGAKPADLPVERATKLEMVVNLKTAKAIGLELATSILLRADEVID